MARNGKLTATQRRIMDVLSDGFPHPVAELLTCLYDEYSEVSVLQVHISQLRKIIFHDGKDVVVVRRNNLNCYQIIPYLHISTDTE